MPHPHVTWQVSQLAQEQAHKVTGRGVTFAYIQRNAFHRFQWKVLAYYIDYVKCQLFRELETGFGLPAIRRGRCGFSLFSVIAQAIFQKRDKKLWMKVVNAPLRLKALCMSITSCDFDIHLLLVARPAGVSWQGPNHFRRAQPSHYTTVLVPFDLLPFLYYPLLLKTKVSYI